MTSYWKRSMAVLLGTGVIALTAACGAEVAGTAQGGIPAAANAVSTSAQATATGENSEEVTTSGEAEPAPSDSIDESSPDTTTESGEVAGPGAAPATTPASESAPTAAPTSESPSEASTSSSKDYAFMEDYCTLMPKSAVTGLEKDTTRDKTSTCTYKTPDSSKTYRFVSVGGGFALSYENLDESYNVDLERVKIDGRDGFTWHNSTKSLYSVLFNLPKPDGGMQSILVVVSDDGSLADMKKQALALAAEVSKEVPR